MKAWVINVLHALKGDSLENVWVVTVSHALNRESVGDHCVTCSQRGGLGKAWVITVSHTLKGEALGKRG